MSESKLATEVTIRPSRRPVGAHAALRFLGIDIFLRPRSQTISARTRVDIQKRLDQTAPLATSAVAKVVFDAVLDGVDRAIDANRQLEGKANGVIVLCVAILGFGANLIKDHGGTSYPVLTAVALVVLVGAIASALAVGWVKTYDLPSVVVYNLPTIIDEEQNEAKILVELSESFSSYARDERNAGLTKAKWYFAATRLLLFGLALFASLAWLSIFYRPIVTASGNTPKTIATGPTASGLMPAAHPSRAPTGLHTKRLPTSGTP